MSAPRESGNWQAPDVRGLQINDMAAFVRSVELGGFSAAARALGLTPSAISKLVTRLEARLGVRLLNRTTRSLALTPE
ncbi:MAG: helix-turn-helix domain-containing protein, partial [Terriglobales bacterium]